MAPAAAVARRRLILDALGISLSAGAFGLVYGFAAREAGFSIVDALAASTLVLAGASQFVAVGLIAQGVPWLAIVGLTALLNARHLLYSSALAPWLAGEPRLERAAMAHTLTDETFALAIAHFRRLGRADPKGFWIAAALVCLPWIGASAVGVLAGEAIPSPASLGLDVIFPAAMAGLCLGLIDGRPELVAAIVGAAVAVTVGLTSEPAVGIVAAGLVGPLAGLAVGQPSGSGPVPPEILESDPAAGVAAPRVDVVP